MLMFQNLCLQRETKQVWQVFWKISTTVTLLLPSIQNITWLSLPFDHLQPILDALVSDCFEKLVFIFLAKGCKKL